MRIPLFILLNFDFYADLDQKPAFYFVADPCPAFHSDAGPDPVSHNYADPQHCLSYSSIKVPLACLLFLTFLQEPLRDSFRRNVSNFIEAWFINEKNVK
jgi:hypothetical protein